MKRELPPLVTIREFAKIYPCFSAKYVLHLLKKAKEYNFAKCVVIIGAKKFIDLDKFIEWLDEHRLTELNMYSLKNLYNINTRVVRIGRDKEEKEDKEDKEDKDR